MDDQDTSSQIGTKGGLGWVWKCELFSDLVRGNYGGKRGTYSRATRTTQEGTQQGRKKTNTKGTA